MASLFTSRGLLVLFVLSLLVLSGDADNNKKSKVKKTKVKKVEVVPPSPPPKVAVVVPPPSAGMSLNFYQGKCDAYSSIVLKHVTAAMQSDPTIAAGILRMHFHDCWIRGCDASVLLDSTDGGVTAPEKSSGPNLSLRGFQVIDSIKAELELNCKGIVSCADILTTAARDGVVLAGGPSWDVPLGRKDGRISRASEVILPSPTDSVSTLLSDFGAKQLTLTDLVGLSGAHTIGFGNCGFFQSRLSNDPTMNSTYAKQLQQICRTSSSAPNDPITPNRFDNLYYSNLQQRKGLFTSDEGLFFDSRTKPLINQFAASPALFASQFQASMTKLITLPPFQSNTGGIRSVCKTVK